jgi:hypothetical protein
VYHIRCFYGTIAPYIRVRHDKKGNNYDLSWNLLETPEIKFTIEKPVHLDKMIAFATSMSKQFEFVRMDFYVDIHDDIYFSEYTFTPNAGMRIDSNIIEIESSKYWTHAITPANPVVQPVPQLNTARWTPMRWV